ncbi:MAG: DNA recombination protein RmuC, partial [Bacteroides sp.]
METILLVVCLLLLLILIYLVQTNARKDKSKELIQNLLQQEMKNNRTELNQSIQLLRQELHQSINQGMVQLQSTLNKNQQLASQLHMERFELMARQQEQLIQSTEKRLDSMRDMVEEKLQKTLNERISQSFEMVRKNLEQVQRGLGEMQSLAQDVGGLKKVLSNVKTRGTFGEVQLGALLDQMLSPEQYEANVKTKRGSNNIVEYAIKLPGQDDDGSVVYLPIDAKF